VNGPSYAAIASLVCAGAALAQAPALPPPDEAARRIVADHARVSEGEIVVVRGNVRDRELLEDVAIRCRAAGAFPLLQYSSDHLTQGLVDGVDPRFDNQLSALDARLASFADCIISLDAADNPGLLNHVPARRLAALARSAAATADLFRRAGVRTVSIGNGLYPTAANANQYALSPGELAALFWRAMEAPESELSAIGDLAALPLAEGKDARITNPNGTDLKLRIAGRRPVVADGTVSDEDLQRGRGVQLRLPAGEVLITPVPNSAEGRLVVDSLAYRGLEVSRLTVVFKGGKVTNLYAQSGIGAIKPLYDAAGPGKEQLGYLSVGVNPEVRAPAGAKLNAPMPQGMVTVFLGNNTRAGGDNASPFELALYLPGSTLAVDGEPLVSGGRLILPTSPVPVETGAENSPPSNPAGPMGPPPPDTPQMGPDPAPKPPMDEHPTPGSGDDPKPPSAPPKP
jgi:leucyl aminopeptidase (aminopeptidase T)